MRAQDFEEQARVYLRRMKESAEELTEALGLSREAKYDLLSVIYQETLPPVPEMVQETASSESSARQSHGGILGAWEWVIAGLFPRRVSLGLAALGGGGSSSSGSEQLHEEVERNLRLQAQLRGRGATSVDLLLRLSWLNDGSPAVGLSVALDHPVLHKLPEQVTDVAGQVAFSGLVNIRPDRWKLTIRSR